jgi:tyrosinase
LLVAPAISADGVLKRKNIDKLTKQELEAYEHAIQIMKDRSAKNPYDKSGFLWQAWARCRRKALPNSRNGLMMEETRLIA